MRILHITESIDPKSGGPTRSVKGICRALSKKGLQITLLVNKGRHEFEDACGCDVIYGEDLDSPLDISGYDLIHLQGLWSPALHRYAVAGRCKKIPYVISPRGMLDPWALSVKRWKKRIAMFLYQRRDLEGAAAFHVTAKLEEISVRAQRLRQFVIIAPNGIDIPKHMPPKTATKSYKTALFLSRLHPGKGLLTLADAWAQVQPKGWRMKVVGPDSYGHKADLVAKLISLGILDQWEFVDMLDDVEKWKAYRGADLLIHPSVSENFGITIAEGLAAGLPVIATKGAPWHDLVEYRCGWWIDNRSSEALAKALAESTGLDWLAREEMGARGARLVEEKYSWPTIAMTMFNGYMRILSDKEFIK